MNLQTSNFRSPPRRRPGFSLVELLVVIGIIVLLMGILLPTLSRVRKSGQRTRAEAVLQNISAAIGVYQLQFRSYPGAAANAGVMCAGNTYLATAPTSSENLLLSLAGGLINRTGPVIYDPTLLGSGPRNLLNNQGKQYPPLIEGAKWSDPNLAHFTDADGSVCTDSGIPEFLDGYDTDPLPVLYMRANVGKTGIASEDLTTQYDASELYPYTRHLGGGTKHGLRSLGLDTDAISSTAPNTARPYLKSTTLGGSPRTPDGFILISAGPDRLFGTADDITSFGPVIP